MHTIRNMEFINFYNKFKLYQLITYSDIVFNFGEYSKFKDILKTWRKEKKLIQLKRGMYTLGDEYRKVHISKEYLSNKMYTPSYVSLHYALCYYYDMIPEAVFEVTAVSTNKTARFENSLGRFSYNSIKSNAFFGYELVQDSYKIPILVATREKALLDMLYFDKQLVIKEDYLLEGLRLQNYEALNIKKLQNYATKFESKKIKKISQILINLIKEERKS